MIANVPLNRITLIFVLAAICLFALPTIALADGPVVTHTIYLPIIISSRRPPSPSYAVQGGWGRQCCQTVEQALNLAPHMGANAHIFDSYNSVQPIQTYGWFSWFNSTYPPGLAVPPCSYNQESHTLVSSAGCRSWASANPGKIYVIGNEPDIPFSGGGDEMESVDDYVRMWDVTTSAIASADPTAKFVQAAVAHLGFEDNCTGGSGFEMVRQFALRRGTSVYAWNLHLYSHSTDQTWARRQVSCFAQRVHEWKVSGRTNSDTLWITELGFRLPSSGWGGTRDFMQGYLPWLEAQSQVEKWMWWEWGEYTLLLDQNSNPTPAGLCYANLAQGLGCY